MKDFLIIGGGIAGVSLASELAAHGSLVLLEAEIALAYHASGRSAAAFEKNYGLTSTVELTVASEEGHLAFDVLSPRGLMLLAKANEQSAFKADVTALGLETIDVSDAKAILPILDDSKIVSAAYHADTWDIDTDRLCQRFVSRAKRNGAEFATSSVVTGIERLLAGWRITSGEMVYETRNLINAAGPWADPIAILSGIKPLGLQPFRRSMGRIPAPGEHDISKWPLMFGPGESWYAKPDAGALIVSPADEDPSEPMDAYPDDMVLAQGFARYESYVTESVTRLLSSWAGLRTFAPDRQLVLGRDVADPTFIWCAGQGGYGMQSSHGAAKFLADTILERPVSMSAKTAAALDPKRFH